MQQAECDVTGTVLYSLASSPPYFCNQTQGCARDRAEHGTVCSVLGECMASGGYRRDRQAYWSRDKSSPTPPPHVCLQPLLLSQQLTEVKGSKPAALGSTSFRTEVKVAPREKDGRATTFLYCSSYGGTPVFGRVFCFVSYFKTHLCNSPKSLMKRFYFASESQLRLMKEAIKV